MGFYWPKNYSLSDSIPELSLLLKQKEQLPKATNMFSVIAGYDW